MEPIKALGRVGLLGKNLLNHMDGGVEILDDLDDHWTARHHKDERNWFIQELQDLAAEKSVRVTILGYVIVSRLFEFVLTKHQGRCPSRCNRTVLLESKTRDSQRPGLSLHAKCHIFSYHQCTSSRCDGRYFEQAEQGSPS
jgi:hypothetical protein